MKLRTNRLTSIRRALLFSALTLTLVLFGFDRYAAYAYRPAPESKQVILYTTVWCPYCAKLRRDMDASGIGYVERDVEQSLSGALGFWALRGRGVPVSAIGPRVVHGYQVAEIAEATAAIGYTFIPAAEN